MNIRFLTFLPLLCAVHCQMLLAELQGPEPVQRDAVDGTTEAVPEPAAPTTTEESKVSNNNNNYNNNNVEALETPSNERKSAKYASEQETTAATAGIETDLEQRSKIVQAAIFERLWNEKLVKEKLKEKIDAIEAGRPTTEPVPPTVAQIIAEAKYTKAIDMLAKSRPDKKVAYNLLREAAEASHTKARVIQAWSHLLGHWVEYEFDFIVSELEELAKEGLTDANMGLAYLYSTGLWGKNVSQPLTLIYLTLAALGDNDVAQMALGYRYSFGINVPVSCETSLMYYKKVAKKVASKVTFSNGPVVHRVHLLDESENPGSHETEIVDYYQLLADKGDVQSQVGLGHLYYQGGKAIQQDHQKALEYFTQAANAGNAVSFAFLGKLYLEGSEFIKADNETAFKNFKKAADLGDPVGQSGLGLMYLKGLGVPKDTLKALNYFTQAADQGWVDGQLQLGNMYFTGNGVKTDYKLAFKYFNLASQSGHVLAYYNLGIMHAYGMGMLRSCPTAVEFFKNVAERGRWSRFLMHAYSDYKNGRMNEAFMQYAFLAELGYEVAQSNAAFLLDREDVSIFQDRHEELIRAFYYWKRSAAQGYSAAQVKLGDYYYYGWGTEVDFETAAALYRKASEQQYNAQAMFNLGYMHEQGLGMKKDWHLAKRLYDLAAETNADAKVPVAIALLKLQILAKIEAIKESPYKFIFYLDENIAANWDLYVITILTLLLGFIMYTRRPYQQQQQPQQANATANEQQPNPEQQAAATNNNDTSSAATTADNGAAGGQESVPATATNNANDTATSTSASTATLTSSSTADAPSTSTAAASASRVSSADSIE